MNSASQNFEKLENAKAILEKTALEIETTQRTLEETLERIQKFNLKKEQQLSREPSLAEAGVSAVGKGVEGDKSSEDVQSPID